MSPKLIFSVLILFSGLILHWHPASGQNEISGIVYGADSLPLEGALIYLPDMQTGSVTDDQGRFSLHDLPPGRLLIQFVYLGYNTEVRTFQMEGKSLRFDIYMIRAVITSQEVVISGGIPSSQHENAVRIDVLKSQNFALAGAPGIMQSLTQIPGVDMISRGPGIEKPVIRGMSGNNVLVLYNGSRIENYQFGEEHPLGVDENNIDQVEVIKGPSSLLYGSDALGGVLNFIPGKPATVGNICGEFNTRVFSNTMGVNSNLGIKGASRHYFGNINAGFKSHEDFKQGGGDFVPNSRFNEYTVNVVAGYTAVKSIHKILYNLFNQKLGMTAEPIVPLITEAGRINHIWYQDLQHHFLASDNLFNINKYRLSIKLSGQSAHRMLRTVYEDPFIEMRLNTLGYEARLQFPSPETSSYLIGLQGMNQWNRNLHCRLSRFLPNADIFNIGLFGLIQHTFRKKITLQGGLRFDYYQTRTEALGDENSIEYHPPVANVYLSVNGSIGSTFEVSKYGSIRINLAKAFRVPNISELTSRGMHGERFELGNASLKPEQAWELDAGMHHHAKFLSVDISAFCNYIEDFIYLSPTDETDSSGNRIFKYMQNNAWLYGGEAGLHFHPPLIPWLHLQGSYALVYGIQENGEYLPFIPAQKFHYELRLTREKLRVLRKSSIWIAANSTLAQNHPAPTEEKSNAYTILDAGIYSGIRVGKQLLSVGFTVNNILDTKYIDHLSTLRETDFFNPGRNMSLFVNIPFGVFSQKQQSL